MQSNKLYYASGAVYAVFEEASKTYFYEDGALKTLEPYLNGRLHGAALLYWPNGKLKREVHFAEGIREGADRMWSEEGQLLDEGCYEKGTPVGLHRRWGPKGDLIEEIEYLDRLRFNLKHWDETGQLRYEGVWSGNDFFEKTWDRFKKVWSEKRGRLEGKRLVYV